MSLFGYARQDEISPGGANAAGGHSSGVFFAEAIPPSHTEAGKARRRALSAGSNSTELLEYAATLQAGEWVDDAAHAAPGPMFEPEALKEYVSRCEPEFVQHSHPRRFCKHRMLYEVKGE